MSQDISTISSSFEFPTVTACEPSCKITASKLKCITRYRYICKSASSRSDTGLEISPTQRLLQGNRLPFRFFQSLQKISKNTSCARQRSSTPVKSREKNAARASFSECLIAVVSQPPERANPVC